MGRGERALQARTEWRNFHQAGVCDLKGSHSASFKKVNIIRLCFADIRRPLCSKWIERIDKGRQKPGVWVVIWQCPLPREGAQEEGLLSRQ